MSDSKPMISPENVPTIAAVAAILAMLAFAYGAFVHRQVYTVAVGVAAIEVKQIRHEKEVDDVKIKALEDRMAAVEAKIATTTVAADAAPAVPAEPVAAPPQ